MSANPSQSSSILGAGPIDLETTKSGPRRANDRAHGNEGMSSMQSEHIARETTRVVRHLLHDARLTGALGDDVGRWTDNGQMRVAGSGVYTDAYEAFFDSPDGRYGLSVVVRLCDRKGDDGAA